jgi:hypothetical protein
VRLQTGRVNARIAQRLQCSIYVVSYFDAAVYVSVYFGSIPPTTSVLQVEYLR